MSNKILNFELIEELPEDYGTYLFLREDGSIKEGYFGSFPYPYHEDEVRLASCKDEKFYYSEIKIVGWLKRVE